MERFRHPIEPREATPHAGKFLEKSLADSGYNTSELSTISESHLSHFRGSSIEEDVEIDDTAEPPTPTTRNLSKFSALQLTTPKSKCELCSPLKRTISNDGSATPKKLRRNDENHSYETPKKGSFGRKKSFRERIKSDIDIKSSPLPLSPIASNIAKSASKILGENQFENLSSTPIKHGFRPDFYVETVENVCFNPLLPKSRSPKVKRKLLRKIHSFSPRKWQLGRNYTRRLEQCPSPIPIDEETQQGSNPAQGIITCNAKQFENLLTVPKHSSFNEIKTNENVPNAAPAAGLENFSATHHVLETVEEEEEKNGLNLAPLEEISSQSIREYFHEMQSMTEEASGCPPMCLSRSAFRHKDSLELLHIATSAQPQRKDEATSQEEMMDISLTPKQFNLDDSVEEARKGTKRSSENFEYSPSVLHTPKKVRRCTSFQYSSDEEKHRLLYPNLPCTPPKKRARKALDYSTKSPRGSIGERTPRRCRPPKRNSYEGTTTLNILSRLAGTIPALDRIFAHLRPEDLHAVHNVCRDWRMIVNGHHQARKRLIDYQEEQIPIKENFLGGKKFFGKNATIGRVHLRDLNSLDEEEIRRQSVVRSPPNSPSTRKHRDHQKFLARLDERAKVISCPKCYKSSLIMSPRRQKRCAMATVSPMKRSPAKRNLFRANNTIGSFPARREDKMLGATGKSYSLPDDLSTFERELCVRNKSLLIGDGVRYETYAICSRESCRFTFCTTCFRERHEVGKCVELEPRSPVRVEEEYRRRIVPGSKRSKRNLKRL